MPGQPDYALLGPLAVRRGGATVTISPGRQRTVLATLLLRAGHLVPLAELTEAAWGSMPPPTARVSLQNYVARLRKALSNGARAPISTLPGGYLITVGDGELDVHRFEEALAAGQAATKAGAWADAARLLRGGLELWRGEPLADIASELLTLREVPRLTELRLQATEARIEADLHLGRHTEVIAELRQLTAAEPLRERLSALLMTALYLDGQQAGALAAYQAARKQLVSELGTEPGPELRRVHQQVLTGDPIKADEVPDGHAAGAGREQARYRTAIRFSLPPDTAAFTGRDTEIGHMSLAVAGLAEAGAVPAIYAIAGMPGVGKTTLAVHAAHLLADQFPDRQLFVDLQGHAPGQVPLAPEAALASLLATVGVDPRYLPGDLAGRAAMWRDRMAGQRALLVLDNAASSAQVVPLLPGGGNCLVMVTSRRHLADLPGAVVPVLLDVLPPGEAREMFLSLAPRARAGPAAVVAEVAGLAGHLPLAITLLARMFSRHPAWTLADLVEETKARLLTLSAESDSVAAAFEVSWQHLEPGEQTFLRQLCVHPGTAVDAYAAAALAGIPLGRAAGYLDTLHGEGLLTETGYRRYGMHDLIRRFATDRAGDDCPAQRAQALGRLLDYYEHTVARSAAFLARQAPDPPGPAAGTIPAALPVAPGLPDSATALAWARAERANVLACLDQAARAGELARVASLTAVLAELLRKDGPWTDAIRRHTAAVSAARQLGDRAAEAVALGDLGIVQRLTGDYRGAVAALEEAEDIHRAEGNHSRRATVLRELGVVRYSTSDYPGAAQLFEEAHAIFGDLGDQRGLASTLHDEGDLQRMAGDLADAARVLAEALGIYRDLADERGQASTLARLGHVRLMTGDHPGAAGNLEEALSIYNKIHERPGKASVLLNVGTLRMATGDHEGAALALENAGDIYRDLGSRLGLANALGMLGGVRRVIGDHPGAEQLFGESLPIFCDLGDRGAQAVIHNEMGALHHAQGRLGQASDCHRLALDIARDIGGSWDEAHALAGLGRCVLAAGDPERARALLQEARDIFERIGASEAADVAAELTALAGPPGAARA